MTRLLLAAGALLLLVPEPATAQDDAIAESRSHYREAARAYEARDWRTFLDHARRAQALRPAHGGYTYALASAYALTGDTAGAFGSLRRFAAMGYTAELAADSDFAALRGAAAYAELERRLRANREPVVRGTVGFELPELDLLAEGVAYDPREGAFFVSGVHQRKIVRRTADGRVTDFARLEADGLGTPLGIRVDPGRRVLWVAAAALPQMRGYTPADSSHSALLRYRLADGRLTGRYPVPADGRAHVLGDVVVTGGGDVIVSDSRAPVLYRLRSGGEALEPLIESPLLTSAQGLALLPGDTTLYVADYSRGILRVDLASRTLTPLPAPDTVTTLGIDGLYYLDGTLIGIQNGVAPHRVVRLALARDGRAVTGLEVLERAHPRHDEPTLGVMVGRELYYVANSQYERFGRDGQVSAPDRLRPPTILRLRL